MVYRYLVTGKKVIFRVGLATTVIAYGQASWYRYKYGSATAPLPSGPMKGVEFWLGKVRLEIKDVKATLNEKALDKVRNISVEIQDVKVAINDKLMKLGAGRFFSRNNAVVGDDKKRKLKLLIVGDSLVSGVGCASPVLPSVLATFLSVALKADVEWRAEGLVGGTVNEIRSRFLPVIAEEFESSSEATEIVVVLICGLNDWKTVLTQFPYGSGPNGFRSDLAALIGDIKSMAGTRPCKVYLPALPIVCGREDPNCILQQKPLKYFVDAISYTWDMQKRAVAEENELKDVTFIDPPDMAKEYATPGAGNVCEDGIHPSLQGYLWWGTHIADAIIRSERGGYSSAAVEGRWCG